MGPALADAATSPNGRVVVTRWESMEVPESAFRPLPSAKRCATRQNPPDEVRSRRLLLTSSTGVAILRMEIQFNRGSVWVLLEPGG